MERTLQTKKRNGNIELLRMVCMCMIILLHALHKGDLLVRIYEVPGVNPYIAWLLESFSVCAVNTFMLISGYYMSRSRFKLGRLIELVSMVLLYSLASLGICLILGIDSLSGKGFNDLLYYFFPVHNRLYWFMTLYILIYIFSPMINRGIEAMNQKQHKYVIILAVISESLFKSFLPGRFEPEDRGFGFLWLLIVYIIGAYIRKYGFKFFNSARKGIVTYVIASLLIFAEILAVQYINGHYGRLLQASEVSLDYNHIFVICAALGLFSYGINKKPMKEKLTKAVCFFSPMTLGVYLIHENMSLRYQWQGWLGIRDIIEIHPVLFILKLELAVFTVFAAGMLVDYFRIKLFTFVQRKVSDSPLGRRMERFNSEMNER